MTEQDRLVIALALDDWIDMCEPGDDEVSQARYRDTVAARDRLAHVSSQRPFLPNPQTANRVEMDRWLMTNPPLEHLTAWLCWNDPNGEYWPSELGPLTRDQALAHVEREIQDIA